MVFKGQKVLIVEDNLISYKLLEAHLKRKNLSLIHASDGKTALEEFRKNPDIKIILMDMQLPEVSGLEVTHLIRELNADLPIIATTANAFEEDRIAATEAGCNHFISKPIHFDTLFKILKEYLQ